MCRKESILELKLMGEEEFDLLATAEDMLSQKYV